MDFDSDGVRLHYEVMVPSAASPLVWCMDSRPTTAELA